MQVSENEFVCRKDEVRQIPSEEDWVIDDLILAMRFIEEVANAKNPTDAEFREKARSVLKKINAKK